MRLVLIGSSNAGVERVIEGEIEVGLQV